MHIIRILAFTILIGLLLSACGPAAQIETTSPSETPLPSSTATATPIPTQTLTPTITPTLTPPNPLSIDYLNQQSYSGNLTIEKILDQKETYSQQIVSYQSEGLKIYALLTVPKGDPPETGWPVIIFNHGFIPPDVYTTTVGYGAYVHAFADHGYIVLKPDYRGHGNSEGEPVNTYFHQGNTIDVLNAVAAVKNWETADPDRIGMWGHSMGGWITMRAMIINSNIRAGEIWAGAIGSYGDLCVHWFNCENWDDATWKFWLDTPFGEYGLPHENEDFWNSVSTGNYLSELAAAVQLHHATTDVVVPVALSRVMAAKMTAAGITVEFHEYPGDDHNISQTFDLAMERSVEFFDLHLKNSE